ncbi:hypothetical protein Patl1_19804 [Pistacia atlantica]|uniref:Uncharacterized protein n=1 Tax=Pistacia atlantica TaxID=434234 RepID=A0ACC1BNY4_9ROSI|nr:hypothetical protein Patl1_19804 [Pistacia atlantica]
MEGTKRKVVKKEEPEEKVTETVKFGLSPLTSSSWTGFWETPSTGRRRKLPAHGYVTEDLTVGMKL